MGTPLKLAFALLLSCLVPLSLTAQISGDDSYEIDVRTIARRSADPIPSPVVKITTEPSGASIAINFTDVGNAPLDLKDILPGSYRVTVKKAGYRTVVVPLTVESGKITRLKIRLRESTGVLKILTEPSDADVYVGDTKISGMENRLPAGTHAIRVRRFGYDDFTALVEITEDSVATVQVNLTPAVFQVSRWESSRKIFNPENPGILGVFRADFDVTAPGRGTVSILDVAGSVVFTKKLPPFITWGQSFEWDGNGIDHRAVPDGDYTVVLKAESARGENAAELTRVISVDRSLIIRYRNVYSGLSGLLFAPTATILPVSSFILSSGIFWLSAVQGGGNVDGVYLSQVGMSFGTFEDLELTPLIAATVDSSEDPPDLTASLGAKYVLVRGHGQKSFSAALTGKGVYMSSPTLEGFSLFPGLSVGAAFEYKLGYFGFLTAPEIQLSYISPQETSFDDAAFRTWPIGRFGVFFDSGELFTGISTSFAMKPVGEGIGTSSPIQTGMEFHWLLPDSLLNVSGYMVWEYSGDGNDRIFLGGGLGVVY